MTLVVVTTDRSLENSQFSLASKFLQVPLDWVYSKEPFGKSELAK